MDMVAAEGKEAQEKADKELDNSGITTEYMVGCSVQLDGKLASDLSEKELITLIGILHLKYNRLIAEIKKHG